MSRPIPGFTVAALCIQPVSWALAYGLLQTGILARLGDRLVQNAFTAAPVIALAMLIGFVVVMGILGVGLAVVALIRAEQPRFVAYLSLAVNILIPFLVLLKLRY